MKAFTILTAMLMLSEAVWAVVVPPNTRTGATYVRCEIQANVTTYTPGPNTPIGTSLTIPQFLASGGTAKGPRGGLPGEDAWGIFSLFQLADGAVDPNGGIGAPVEPGTIYYDNSAGLSNTWLVGMFHGGQDQSIKINPNNASEVEVTTKNLSIELWAVDPAKLSPLADPTMFLDYVDGSRTDADQYAGWLDASVRSAGVRLMEATSTWSDFTGGVPSGGEALVYANVIPGSGAWSPDPPTSGFSPHFQAPDGSSAEVFFNFTVGPTRTWDLAAFGHGGWVVTPEPATLSLLVFGGLALIRRR